MTGTAIAGRDRAAPQAAAGYEPHIDGLRGIAVLLVLLFHARVPGAGGGFVGVDVFFVISGYLIIGHLAREAALTGTVGIAAFFARRVRRLAPAFAVVVASTLVLAAGVFTRAEFASLLTSAMMATLSLANERFRVRDYFAPDAEVDPLLHTWSLSVEEQFYLIAPIGALLAVRRFGPSAPRRQVLLLAVACAGSLAFSEWLVATERTAAAFFLMPSRAWEIAAGGLAAFVGTAWRRRMGHPLVTGAAFAAIGVTAAVLTESSRFPGATVIPLVAASAALILGGGCGKGGALLRWPPLAYTGRISYPLYLWHWPLLVIANVTRGPSPVRDLGLLIVSFTLAAATYHLVEKPVRRRVRTDRRPRLVVGAGLAAAAATIVAAAAGASFANAATALPTPPWEALARQEQSPFRARCHTFAGVDEVDAVRCLVVDADAAPVVVVWGDSHADAWVLWPAGVAGTTGGFDVIQATKSSCPPVLSPGDLGLSTDLGACARFNASVLRLVTGFREAGRPVTVVMAARWPEYAAGGRERDVRTVSGALQTLSVSGVRATLRSLVASGIDVRLVGPVPEAAHPVPTCMLRWGRSAVECGVGRDVAWERAGAAQGVLEAAVPPGARLLRPFELLCDGVHCPAARDGHVVYYDDNHPSATAVRAMGRRWSDELPGVRPHPKR